MTIGTLPRISRETLASLLVSSPSSSSKMSPVSISSPSALAIIDVRDSDYIGGHIRGCTNVPSPTLDYRVPELVRTLKDKEVVVFHCALSQQRGPGAALRYLREREKVMKLLAKDGGSEKDERKEGEGEGEGDEEDGKSEERKEQQVFVLDGGFVKWQEK
jgi:rhodanese-related sulfurtransferase